MATSLASLIADVYTLTNRPDLVGETLLAVKNATLKAHASDYYYKDIRETAVQFTTAEYLQSLDYRTLIPLWRAVKYLRKVDITTTPPTPGKFLKLLTTEEVLDSYEIQRENVFYVAGTEVQIRSNTEEQYYLLGCYVRPSIIEADFNSWIADEAPMAIVYEAAATVFKTIGYDEQMVAYRNMVAEEYAALRLTNTVANGY